MTHHNSRQEKLSSLALKKKTASAIGRAVMNAKGILEKIFSLK